MPPYTLYIGDCLEELKRIPDGSVDLILDDLPYGCLNKATEGGQWDSIIPLVPLWAQFLRVAKPNAPIILFGQGLFSAKLMMSQPKLFRYSLVWDKCRASGFLNANRMPLRTHEDILIFYRSLPTYHPQMEEIGDRKPNHSQGRGVHKETNKCYGDFKRLDQSGIPDKKFPGSILKFPRPHCTGNHPTEKSVNLCRWLIRAYSNEGDTVLDATMGSGTSGCAALLEDRMFIGIEREEKYFALAKKRIDKAYHTQKQLELFFDENEEEN